MPRLGTTQKKQERSLKKLLLLLCIFATESMYSFDYLFCCCKKKALNDKNNSTRNQWVIENLACDLQEIGIECSQKDIENLSFEQRLFLDQLKNSYRASAAFEYYVQSSKMRADEYAEPIKSGLIKFHKNFTQLKKQLSVLQSAQQKIENE